MVGNSLYYVILSYIAYIIPAHRYKLSYTDLQNYCKSFLGKTFKITTLRKEVSILKTKGYIGTKKRYGKQVPALNSSGQLYIAPALPRMKREPWDGKWRVVTNHIPTSERHSKITLEKKLNELGFRKIFHNTFISPNSYLNIVHRYATDLGVRQYIMLFDTENLGQEPQTIRKAWHLNEINTKYRRFTSLAKRKLKSKKRDDADWPLIAKKLESTFLAIYTQDPNFPEELLPNPWHGAIAQAFFKKVTKSY